MQVHGDMQVVMEVLLAGTNITDTGFREMTGVATETFHLQGVFILSWTGSGSGENVGQNQSVLMTDVFL